MLLISWLQSKVNLIPICDTKYNFLTFIATTRDRFVQLVSQAYSSISLTEFSNFVGMSEGQAEELAQRQPVWTVDTQSKIINPVKSEVKETESIPSEHQLRLLTDFVAFLEK